MSKKPLLTKKFYSINDLIQIFPISKSTAYLKTQQGEIPSIKLGNRTLIPVDWVEKMLHAVDVRG